MSSILNAFGIEQLPKRALWFFYHGFADLGLNPDCGAVVVSIESAFNPKALNKYSGASGLLQVMPGLTKHYGYASTAAIRAASAEEQIKRIVIPHFKSFASSLKNANCGSYYLAVFLPKFINAPDSTLIGEKGSSEIIYGKTTAGKLYEQNFGFDTDNDGVFTVGDIRNFAISYGEHWGKRPRVTVPDSLPPPTTKSGWVPYALSAAVGALIYTLVRRPP